MYQHHITISQWAMVVICLGSSSHSRAADTPEDALPTPAVAIDSTVATPASPAACVALQSSAERLKCYDATFGRQVEVNAEASTVIYRAEQATPVAVIAAPTPSTNTSLFAQMNPFAATPSAADEPLNPNISLLDRRWELSDDSKLGTFNLRAYKPVYILPAFYTGNPNLRPRSPNPLNQASSAQALEDTEAKFQISFKTKAVEGVLGKWGDVWLGYTQSSHWQVYNPDASRPFRETNYEPEASLIFRTQYDLLGWKGRLLGVSVNHQSNGRSQPLSRSWNRVIGQVGIEKGNWAIMARPWLRIAEPAGDDDNADMEDYMGRGDLHIVRKDGEQEFALMLRHSLKGGDRSHGAVQLDWTFPVQKNLRGYVQVFDGYGESLIDYNHRATYVGVGISLLNWY
ncbi:MAG: hypothetical protein RL180_1085 [Pseudomonadota bacterium]|jgi:phospholipase A1